MLVIAASCGVESRTLAADYCLFYEDFTYYVLTCYHPHPSGPGSIGGYGPFGIISNVGWDDRYIVAWREMNGPDRAGYMILDTQADTLEGPYSSEEFPDRRRRTPALARIEVLWAREALRR